MSPQEIKVNVIAKDGEVKLLTGSDFHLLSDLSFHTYKTADIDSFIRHVTTYDSCFELYYNDTSAILYSHLACAKGYKHPAELQLQKSPYVELLSNMSRGLGYSVKSLEELIMKLRPYADIEAKELLDISRNLKLSKVTEIESSRDKKGNYNYSVKKVGGNDDIALPEIISFTVPVFMHLNGEEDRQTFEFEPVFSYDEIPMEKGGGVNMNFTFLNYQFDEVLLKAQKEILERHLANAGDRKRYYGSVTIHERDNSWTYQKNPI